MRKQAAGAHRERRVGRRAEGPVRQRAVRRRQGRDPRLLPELARDVAPEIRVNTVAPGRTRTGMTEPLMIERAGSVEQGSVMFGQGNLQKRVAEPAEIAAPVCFLLSNEASFITGALLVVDGGETAI